MAQEKYKEPDWYDPKKVRKAWYAVNEYSGWVIDLGDGTCRYINSPLLGENGPKWGDRVRLIQNGSGLPIADASEILEKYDKEKDRIPDAANH